MQKLPTYARKLLKIKLTQRCDHKIVNPRQVPQSSLPDIRNYSWPKGLSDKYNNEPCLFPGKSKHHSGKNKNKITKMPD